MKLKQFLTKNHLREKYLNLFNSDIERNIDEIWKILEISYEAIGGFLGADNKQDLIDKTYLAKCVRRGGNIIAVTLYKDQRGRKMFAAGSNGTRDGKLELMKLLQDDISLRRSWAEVSGALEHITINKLGGIPIPNSFAEELTGKTILSYNPDGFHYTRMIGQKPVEKILIGNIAR